MNLKTLFAMTAALMLGTAPAALSQGDQQGFGQQDQQGWGRQQSDQQLGQQWRQQ